MMANLIDGKAVAQTVYQSLRTEIAELKAKGVTPGLAVVLVGHNPASEIYVRGKVKASEEVGIYSEQHTPPESRTTDERGTLRRAQT